MNQEQLAWVDRSGVQHTLATLGNNSCDARSPTLMTDVGEINDMTKLPLFKIIYGPLHESAQMIVHVGPLECLPKEEDQSYSLRNHVMDLESKIDENNDAIVKKDEECKEKMQELATKDIQHDQNFENMKLDLESKIDENNDTIVKNNEKCKEKLQELATKDLQYDQELENIRLMWLACQ